MMNAKVYIASSWKNAENVRLIADLLRKNNVQVDDFTDDSRGRYVFSYLDLPEHDKINGIDFLTLDQAKRAFIEDKKMIDWADAVLLLLPCGRSAHLEAGYAVGMGKHLIILGEFPPGEFDVMYGFASLVTSDLVEAVKYFTERNWF